MGTTAGAVSGAAVGGPVGAGGGAVVGYAGGKTAQLMDENEDLAETVESLSHGDVQALVQKSMEKGMEQHQSTFDEFASYIKNILIIAACVLGVYLSIPIFVARKTAETCSKSEAEKLTRPPFPTPNEKS